MRYWTRKPAAKRRRDAKNLYNSGLIPFSALLRTPFISVLHVKSELGVRTTKTHSSLSHLRRAVLSINSVFSAFAAILKENMENSHVYRLIKSTSRATSAFHLNGARHQLGVSMETRRERERNERARGEATRVADACHHQVNQVQLGSSSLGGGHDSSKVL